MVGIPLNLIQRIDINGDLETDKIEHRHKKKVKGIVNLENADISTSEETGLPRGIYGSTREGVGYLIHRLPSA